MGRRPGFAGPLPPPVLRRLASLAEAEPDREVCGLVVARPGGPAEVWPARNAAADPGRAFAFEPGELLALLRRADEAGAPVVAVYHSHPGGGAGLSQADLHAALLDGRPALPGAAQVVVALEGGRAIEVVAWRHQDGAYRAAERLGAISPGTGAEDPTT